MNGTGKKVADKIASSARMPTQRVVDEVAGTSNDKRFDRDLSGAEWPMKIPVSGGPFPAKIKFAHDGKPGM